MQLSAVRTVQANLQVNSAQHLQEITAVSHVEVHDSGPACPPKYIPFLWPRLIHVSLAALKYEPKSAQEWLSHFCTVHPCAQHTQTMLCTASVAVGHIYAQHSNDGLKTTFALSNAVVANVLICYGCFNALRQSAVVPANVQKLPI